MAAGTAAAPARGAVPAPAGRVVRVPAPRPLPGAPLVLGYHRAGHGRRAVLDRFAEREGFVLVRVFVEGGPDPRRGALASLVSAARQGRVAAVLVPAAGDLGTDEASSTATRRLIERRTGVPVLLALPG